MTIVSYRNRFSMLYVYALLLSLFVKKMIGFKNEREKVGFLFYWTWRDFESLAYIPF